MKIPPRIDYIETYLTFRCGFRCEYCINAINSINRNRKEISGQTWVDFINNIETSVPITMGGGEPTLHKDFYKIVDGIKNHKIELLTNGMFNIDEFISKVDTSKFNKTNYIGHKSIRISYHPMSHDQKDLISRVLKLQKAGFNVGIFGISAPQNTQFNTSMAELTRKNRIYFFCKEFLGEYSGTMHGTYRYPKAISGCKKIVNCRPNELLISPDGKIYRCHRYLYNSLEHDYDVNSDEVVFDYKQCCMFGGCNPCDVKLKLNKDLQYIKSSMDIEGGD